MIEYNYYIKGTDKKIPQNVILSHLLTNLHTIIRMLSTVIKNPVVILLGTVSQKKNPIEGARKIFYDEHFKNILFVSCSKKTEYET